MEKQTKHTKRELDYIQKYQNEHYDKITIKAEKDKMLKNRLETLSMSTGKSKNMLIVEAIEKLLLDNDL